MSLHPPYSCIEDEALVAAEKSRILRDADFQVLGLSVSL
jgi:hypothetical protein